MSQSPRRVPSSLAEHSRLPARPPLPAAPAGLWPRLMARPCPPRVPGLQPRLQRPAAVRLERQPAQLQSPAWGTQPRCCEHWERTREQGLSLPCLTSKHKFRKAGVLTEGIAATLPGPGSRRRPHPVSPGPRKAGDAASPASGSFVPPPPLGCLHTCPHLSCEQQLPAFPLRCFQFVSAAGQAGGPRGSLSCTCPHCGGHLESTCSLLALPLPGASPSVLLPRP